MEDNSFIYFTQDDIINKIDIDPRLLDSFKRVMTRIQKYFNEKGYTKDRDYKTFLEKYFLALDKRRFKFVVEGNMTGGMQGYYNRFNKIAINEKLLSQRPSMLDETLCHEFIHFLVMHELDYATADPSIFKGGFINEALTESLAKEIISEEPTTGYDAQVALHNYTNLISGNKNNFRMFLLGKVDARYSSSAWDNYIKSANAFQKDFDEKGYINLKEAQTNKNFIDAQRCIINLYININSVRTIEDYCDSISKLIDRPVKDTEYINSYVDSLDDIFFNKINIRDINQKHVLKTQLAKLRELIIRSKSNGYSFVMAGEKFTLTEDMNIEKIVPGMQVSSNPRMGTVKIKYKGETLEFDKKDISFDKTEINKEITNICYYFTKNYIANYNMLNKAVEQRGNLLKIEKFTLPNIDLSSNKSKKSVYVATYDNKIVVLNNTEVLSEVENIPMNEYIGVTSLNPSTSAIYQKQLGDINKGIIYTYLNDKQIYNKAILDYSKVVEELISEDELNIAIEEYKNSDFYYKNESDKDTRENVIDILTRSYFEKLSENEHQDYINKVKDKSTKYIVTMNNGTVDVGIMYGNTAFIAKREVLYDVNSKQNYNDIVNGLQQCNIEKNNIDSISIDSNGNIINSKDKENKHKSNIRKVERLLNINITPISDYIATTINNFPKLTLKDNIELIEEQREIIRRLNYLKANNTINPQEYESLKQSIISEYNNMMANAPVREAEEVVEHHMSM